MRKFELYINEVGGLVTHSYFYEAENIDAAVYKAKLDYPGKEIFKYWKEAMNDNKSSIEENAS